jgi:hypothetical protein
VYPAKLSRTLWGFLIVMYSAFRLALLPVSDPGESYWIFPNFG